MSRVITAAANAYLEAVRWEVEREQYHIFYRGKRVDYVLKQEADKFCIGLAYYSDEEIRTEGITLRELISIMNDFTVRLP